MLVNLRQKCCPIQDLQFSRSLRNWRNSAGWSVSHKEMLRDMDLGSPATSWLRRGLKSAWICMKRNGKGNGATLVASYRKKILIFTEVNRFVSSGTWRRIIEWWNPLWWNSAHLLQLTLPASSVGVPSQLSPSTALGTAPSCKLSPKRQHGWSGTRSSPHSL